MKKILVLFIMILSVSMILMACNTDNNMNEEANNMENDNMASNMDNDDMDKENDMNKEDDMDKEEDMDDMEMIELTLEELAKFNGKNGQPAYVAVDGVIYDVSESDFWKDGGHNGFEAGKDLTEAIKTKSPHGVKMLERVPAIGKLKMEDAMMDKDDMEMIELTLEELAKFNGKNGQPAYVAVDGVIYDVSESDFWKDGGHNGFEAGKDLTEAIKTKSPHGVKMLERVPAIGKLKMEDAMMDKDDMEMLELTLEELAKFNGKNGQPAYVAVDGVIYDVSESDFWKNGGHNGFEAGKDLTEAIKTKSPHGVKMLERVPAIGKIVE